MKSPLQRLRFQATKTWMRRPIVWMRHRGLDANDVYLAEYPRCGSTWLRFMMLEILTQNSAGFLDVSKTLPEVGMHAPVPATLPGGGRFIKTHEPYRSDYRRAVYLVRDIRDVLFSMYACDEGFGSLDYFSQGRGLEGYIESYLKGETTRFGSWQGHVQSFLDSPIANSGDLLVIRYEDMRRDTEAVLMQILDFLGVQRDRSIVQGAIANNTLDRMRAKEDSAKQNPDRITKGTLLRNHDKKRFVGAAPLGGWKERLTPEQILLVDEYASDAMRRLGYPLGRDVLEAMKPEMTLQTR
jgi:hypothetical protein